MPIFKAEQLRKVGAAIFEAVGTPQEEAKQTIELLVKSNLCGHDSHGVTLIPYYVEEILKGVCKPGSKIRIVKETATTALVDGGWGLGQVVAAKTMNLSMKKAKNHDIGAVATHQCCHIGRMADYALMAAQQDMIGFCTVIHYAQVVPYGGAEPIFNQGPICIAAPAGEEQNFMLDISTSVCAGGKVLHALALGKRMPEGYIVDKDGNPTTDPIDFVKGGAVLPMGGPVAYKGYGLGMAVDIIAGILTGRGSAYYNRSDEQGVFQMAIRIDAFQQVKKFKAEMDKLIRTVKNSKKAPGFKEILIPGELELRNEKERLKKGIDVPEKTWTEILQIAQKINIDIEPLLAKK